MMIGNKLKEIRTKSGLTQEEVSEKIQVSRQTISNWETEKSYPDIVSVIKLSDLYGVSLDELIKEDDGMIRHLESGADAGRDARRRIFLCILGLPAFFGLNLLLGGIRIRLYPAFSISIEGWAFFSLLLLFFLSALFGIAARLRGLHKAKTEVGAETIRAVLRKADILYICLLAAYVLYAVALFLSLLSIN